MITFYYHPSPNPAKVALMLEETGLAYQMVPIDTRKGEQHSAHYLAINPNAKTPAIVDGSVTVFDSTAILLYLAEKSGQFSADNTPEQRAVMLSWLMFIATGIGPYTGQYVHFNHFAPEPIPYALNRYQFEAWRHWNIIENQLAKQPYMLGERYTLVDMAVWGWARVLPFALGDTAFAKLPNVKHLLDAINARPAAQRAEALKNQHQFKAEMDDEARKAMFPQNERLQG
jgi:GSH-dependent disulfide-bond oxidoreductase